mmetsp:Transcript_50869/g.82249  ORF Transcript_50869/g.82249 Transcript_50869/m.82249 type:complete len:212 (-) Transcript_50869:34-669(-)
MIARSNFGSPVTFGCWFRGAAGLVVGGVDVVLAWRERVRILGLSRKSVHFEEAPCAGREAAVAAHAALENAAGEHILRAQLVLYCAVGGDAQPVTHSLDGAKGPARPAGGLVADVTDVRALRPVLPSIEVFGDRGFELRVIDPGIRFHFSTLRKGSHERLDLPERQAVKAPIYASRPAAGGTVDLLHKAVCHRILVLFHLLHWQCTCCRQH